MALEARREVALVGVLSDSQVAEFDREQVDDARWLPLRHLIHRDFPDGRFSLLDVGGGNGAFADRVLAEFPDATATVMDISDYMLRRNRAHERKTLLWHSAAHLDCLAERYDIVCAHWLLHHLVGADYRCTLANQRAVLRMMARALTSRGRISVFENAYTGWPVDALPGYLIYQLSSSRSLAGIVRRFGANSAGVGVCFQSHKQWLDAFHDAALDCLDCAEPDAWRWPLRVHWRLATTVSDIRATLYWLRPRSRPQCRILDS